MLNSLDASNGLLANDTNLTAGFDNISISVAIDIDATQGTVSLADDGSFIYTPNAAARGQTALPIF